MSDPTPPSDPPASPPPSAPAPAPKPKPGSLRDRIAAFESKPSPSPSPPAPLPRPTRTWKPAVPPTASTPSTTTTSASTAAPDAPPTQERKVSSGFTGMSAEDARESISKGGLSLKERMAALQGKGAFGAPSPPSHPPPPTGDKPRVWKKPVVTEETPVPTAPVAASASPPAAEEGEPPVPAVESAPPAEPHAAHVSAALSPDAPSPADAEPHTEVAAAVEAEEGAPDPEEAERQRRAAIAERMARLGGVRAGGVPHFGGMRVPPKVAPKPVHKPEEQEAEVKDEEGKEVHEERVPTALAGMLGRPAHEEHAAVPVEIEPTPTESTESHPTDDTHHPAEEPVPSPTADSSVHSPPHIPMPIPAAPRRAAPPRRRAPVTPAADEEDAGVEAHKDELSAPAEAQAPSTLVTDLPIEQAASVPLPMSPDTPASATTTSPLVKTAVEAAAGVVGAGLTGLAVLAAGASSAVGEAGVVPAVGDEVKGEGEPVKEETGEEEGGEKGEEEPEAEQAHEDAPPPASDSLVLEPEHTEPVKPAHALPPPPLPSAPVVLPEPLALHPAKEDDEKVEEAEAHVEEGEKEEETAHAEPAHPPEPIDPPPTSAPPPAATAGAAEQEGEDEDEDEETARRARVAERMKKMGGVPLGYAPPARPGVAPPPLPPTVPDADEEEEEEEVIPPPPARPVVPLPMPPIAAPAPEADEDEEEDVPPPLPPARPSVAPPPPPTAVLAAAEEEERDEVALPPRPPRAVPPPPPPVPASASEAIDNEDEDEEEDEEEDEDDAPPPPPARPSAPPPPPPTRPLAPPPPPPTTEPERDTIPYPVVDEEEGLGKAVLVNGHTRPVRGLPVVPPQPAEEEEEEEEEEEQQQGLEMEDDAPGVPLRVDDGVGKLAAPVVGQELEEEEPPADEGADEETFDEDERFEKEEVVVPPPAADKAPTEPPIKIHPPPGETPTVEIFDDDDADPIDPAFYSPLGRHAIIQPATPTQATVPMPTVEKAESVPVVAESVEPTAAVEQDEQDEEQARRQTIAARMAKLGGLRFGIPPPPGMPPKRTTAPPPPADEVEKHDEVDEPNGHPVEAEAEEEGQDPDVVEGVDPEAAERTRRQAILARLMAASSGGGRSMGMMGMVPVTGAPAPPAKGDLRTVSARQDSQPGDQGKDAVEQASAAPLARPPVPPARSLPTAAKQASTDSKLAVPPPRPPPPAPAAMPSASTHQGELTAEPDDVAEDIAEEEEDEEDDDDFEANIHETEDDEELPPSLRHAHAPPSAPPPLPPGRRSSSSLPAGRPAVPSSAPPPPPTVRPTREIPRPPRGASSGFSEGSNGRDSSLRSPSIGASSYDRGSSPSLRVASPSENSSKPWELPPIPSGSLDLGDASVNSMSSWSEDDSLFKPLATPPPPPPPPKTQVLQELDETGLTAVWMAVGQRILHAALQLADQSKRAVIGDGTGDGFVQAVLDIVPGAMHPQSPQVYGYLILQQTAQGILRRTTAIMEGDVAVFADAEFRGRKGIAPYHLHVGGGNEPLVGVVHEFDQKKSKLRVLTASQHANHYPTIESVSYRLEDLKQGSFKVYRVPQA